ncbi:MAG: BRO family protein [Wohlfahrtiimonas sp.]
MSNLINFDFENKQLRTILIDNNPWFVAEDVCNLLKLTNPSMSLKALDEDERSKFNLGRQGDVNIINESGFYTLTLRCRDAVKKNTAPYLIRKWVTNEVLPSIRKTGSYSLTINVEQQYELKKAVNEKSFETGIHYGTIYTMLYDEFKIPRYEELLAKYFDKAITFIKSIGKVIGGKSNLANAPENLDKSRTFALALIKNGALKFDEISNSYESLLNHLSVVTDNLSMVTNQINHIKRMINHIDHGDGAIYDALNEAQIYLFLGDEIRKNATEKAKSLFKPLNLKNI